MLGLKNIYNRLMMVKNIFLISNKLLFSQRFNIHWYLSQESDQSACLLKPASTMIFFRTNKSQQFPENALQNENGIGKCIISTFFWISLLIHSNWSHFLYLFQHSLFYLVCCLYLCISWTVCIYLDVVIFVVAL